MNAKPGNRSCINYFSSTWTGGISRRKSKFRFSNVATKRSKGSPHWENLDSAMKELNFSRGITENYFLSRCISKWSLAAKFAVVSYATSEEDIFGLEMWKLKQMFNTWLYNKTWLGFLSRFAHFWNKTLCFVNLL